MDNTCVGGSGRPCVGGSGWPCMGGSGALPIPPCWSNNMLWHCSGCVD